MMTNDCPVRVTSLVFPLGTTLWFLRLQLVKGQFRPSASWPSYNLHHCTRPLSATCAVTLAGLVGFSVRSGHTLTDWGRRVGKGLRARVNQRTTAVAVIYAAAGIRHNHICEGVRGCKGQSLQADPHVHSAVTKEGGRWVRSEHSHSELRAEMGRDLGSAAHPHSPSWAPIPNQPCLHPPVS